MKSFLEKIAERLVVKFPNSMEDLAVVLPSKRSVIFLKSHLSKLINKPIFLPQFFSVEEFIEEVSGLKVLDNLSLQFYLYQSYLSKSPSDTDSFENFLSWSNVLLHDFNEVDRNLVNAKDIFSNLKNVKELDNWNIENWSFSEDNLTESQTDFNDFYSRFYDWYLEFNKILLEKNLAYQGMAYKKASLEIEKKNLIWQKVWFVGLNALTKSEHQIVDVLKKRDIARVFWDADNYYYLNPLHEAGDFLRIQRDKWKEIDFKGVGDYFVEKKEKFNVIACPNNVSQALVASEILNSISDTDLSESKTAVILADENLLYPVLYHLPGNVKDINITMGSPLKSTAFYSFIDAIFQMQLQNFKNGEPGIYHKNLLKVVNHPLFITFVSSEEILKLRESILESNKINISINEIKYCFSNSFENVRAIFSKWSNTEESLNLIEYLIKHFRKNLENQKNNIESEILYAFNTLFQLLNNLVLQSTFNTEIKTIHSIIQQLVSKEVIPFKGEPLNGIQIMGILESRTLDFKNVILLSVNEGLLPKGKTNNSFIPFDLKLYFKMTTYKENDAVFSYHFYRLLQRAKNIHILYNTETDAFGSGEKSRFITQLLSEYPHMINEYIYNGNLVNPENKNKIFVNNINLDTEIERWSKNISPTSLSTYINCSLSFYFKYLSKIRKSDDISEFAESNTIGTAVHEAFDKVYPKGLVRSIDIRSIKDNLLQKVEDEFSNLMNGDIISSGKNYLSLEIAKKLALNFLQYEAEMLENNHKNSSPLEILESEGKFKYSIAHQNKKFILKGRVDRIDKYEGLLRIIDYKTGTVNQNDVSFNEFEELLNNPKKSKAFQLLVYTYLYLKKFPEKMDNKIIAGNFSFKNLKENLLILSKKLSGNKKEVLYFDREVLNDIETLITSLLTKIISEDFTQTEDVSRCDFCDYKSVCNR